MLILTLSLAPPYADTRDLCFNGPGTVVTGDTIAFNGLAYCAVGTDGTDTLNGFDDPNTGQRDVIWSLAGNDVLYRGQNKDTCEGEVEHSCEAPSSHPDLRWREL